MQASADRRGNVGILRAADRRESLQEAEHAVQAPKRTVALRAVPHVSLDACPGALDQFTVEVSREVPRRPAMVMPEADPRERVRHGRFDLLRRETIPCRDPRARPQERHDSSRRAARPEEVRARTVRRSSSHPSGIAGVAPVASAGRA